MTADLKFGLTLANRSVVLGNGDATQLIDLAVAAEESGQFDSVWVGDSLFVNPRLDSLTLLAAIAGRTERVLIGPACMGSFALRNPLTFAYEWASLDRIAEGRTVLIACVGGGKGADWEAEASALGVPGKQRRRRMLEHIEVLRTLWRDDHATFDGEFFQFHGLTLEPKPAREVTPIWLATNAQRLGSTPNETADVPKGLQRVARLADGWMTHSTTPEGFASSWQTIRQLATEHGRDADALGNCLYHNINVNDDLTVARKEAKRFLDEYYASDFSDERVEAWAALGDPDRCIENLRQYRGSGVERITVRLCADDQFGQLERLVTEVLPHVNA